VSVPTAGTHSCPRLCRKGGKAPWPTRKAQGECRGMKKLERRGGGERGGGGGFGLRAAFSLTLCDARIRRALSFGLLVLGKEGKEGGGGRLMSRWTPQSMGGGREERRGKKGRRGGGLVPTAALSLLLPIPFLSCRRQLQSHEMIWGREGGKEGEKRNRRKKGGRGEEESRSNLTFPARGGGDGWEQHREKKSKREMRTRGDMVVGGGGGFLAVDSPSPRRRSAARQVPGVGGEDHRRLWILARLAEPSAFSTPPLPPQTSGWADRSRRMKEAKEERGRRRDIGSLTSLPPAEIWFAVRDPTSVYGPRQTLGSGPG